MFKFQGPIITVPIKENRKPNPDDWISKTIFDSKVRNTIDFELKQTAYEN